MVPVVVRSVLGVMFVVVLLLAIAAPEAEAGGPFCFSILPFPGTLVWFVNTTGGNQFGGSGRDLSGDRAQTVTGFVTGNSAIFGYTTYSKSSSFATVHASGTINLTTGSGPASCFAPDFESCGAFTLTLIACPLGATTDAPEDTGFSARPPQGMSR